VMLGGTRIFDKSIENVFDRPNSELFDMIKLQPVQCPFLLYSFSRPTNSNAPYAPPLVFLFSLCTVHSPVSFHPEAVDSVRPTIYTPTIPFQLPASNHEPPTRMLFTGMWMSLTT
jgi:hypothetical protein